VLGQFCGCNTVDVEVSAPAGCPDLGVRKCEESLELVDGRRVLAVVQRVESFGIDGRPLRRASVWSWVGLLEFVKQFVQDIIQLPQSPRVACVGVRGQ